MDIHRITWLQGSSIPYLTRLVSLSIFILPCNQQWLDAGVDPSCPRARGSNSLWTHQQSVTVKFCVFKRFNLAQFVFTTCVDGISSKHVWGSSPKTNERGFSACTNSISTSQPSRGGGREHRLFPARSHFTSHLSVDTVTLQPRANTSTAPLQKLTLVLRSQTEKQASCYCFYQGKSLTITHRSFGDCMKDFISIINLMCYWRFFFF